MMALRKQSQAGWEGGWQGMTEEGACISRAYGGMSLTFLAAVTESSTKRTGRREGGEVRRERRQREGGEGGKKGLL